VNESGDRSSKLILGHCPISKQLKEKHAPIDYFPETLAASPAIGNALCLASHLCALNCC